MVDILEFEDAEENKDSLQEALLFDEIYKAEYKRKGQLMRARLKTKFTPRKKTVWSLIKKIFN